jgi:hypothetical protein
MRQTFNPITLQQVFAAHEPAFNVFIACEDNAAFSHARKVEEQVRQLCGDEIKVARVFWSFPLLRHAPLRQSAVREISRAQLIIVAVSTGGELPAHVKSLLEAMPERSQKGQAALVALISGEEGLDAQSEAFTYLRDLAATQGLDFFCNKSAYEHIDQNASAHNRVFPRGLTPTGRFSYQHSWNSGGMNQ